MTRSKVCILPEKEVFFISNVPTQPDSNEEKKQDNVNWCNQFLCDKTNGLISDTFIIYRIHWIKWADKFFKVLFHIDNLLKHLVLLLSCKKLDLSIRTLWFIHIIPQQSHTNFSVCSVYYVNFFLIHFESFVQVFGHCWYQHSSQFFRAIKIICCNDQLFPQSQELVEMCFSHCKICTNRKSLFSSSLKICVLHPSNLNHFWTKKIVEITPVICESPHSRYKIACPKKPYFFEPWVNEINAVSRKKCLIVVD